MVKIEPAWETEVPRAAQHHWRPAGSFPQSHCACRGLPGDETFEPGRPTEHTATFKGLRLQTDLSTGASCRAQGSVTDWKPVQRRSPLCGPRINKGLSIARIPGIDKVCSLNRQLTLYRGHYPAASPHFTTHFLPSAPVQKLLNKNIKMS